MHSDFSPVLFHFTLSLLSADRFRNSRTGVWSSASPLSFQLAWISSSEISVSKRAVSVSITSTLYRGRTSLISRSGKMKGQHVLLVSGREDAHGIYRKMHGDFLTLNVKFSGGLVCSTVTGILADVRFQGFLEDQHPLLAISLYHNIFRWL